MTVQSIDIPVTADDGHGWNLAAAVPAQPKAALLWLPAMGVAAKHYGPLAEALAAHGIAVFLHEMRGNGSSNLRASRNTDWGYRQILVLDLPASQAAMQRHCDIPARSIGGHRLTLTMRSTPSATSHTPSGFRSSARTARRTWASAAAPGRNAPSSTMIFQSMPS